MTDSIINRVSNIAYDIDTDKITLPKSIKIELASICNHKCTYCIVPKLKNIKSFISDEIFYKVINEAKRLKIPEIGLFHMGEGTLHPKFKNYISYVKKTYPECVIFITTNGILLDPLKYAVECNIKSIKFSLNGYNKLSHLDVTSCDTFDLIMQNMQELIEYRNNIQSKTQISASSIYYNNSEQDSFSEYLDTLVDKHYYTQIYNHAAKIDNKFIDLSNNSKILKHLCELPCFGLYNLCHIKTTGDINLCRFGIDEEFTIGNIMNSNLEDIWFSEKANKLRNDSTSGKLNTCNKCVGINNGL